MTVTVVTSNDEPSDVVVKARIPIPQHPPGSVLPEEEWPTATTRTTPPSWLVLPDDDDHQDATTTVLQGERLVVPEWEDPDDRRKRGWCGQDLVHDGEASPVHITDYFVRYGPGHDIAPLGKEDGSCIRGGAGTVLQGIVVFTAAAESHRGYCHGGSMCSIMDDCIGWVAFCVTGTCRPWTGFTVQVNTSLRQPVPVHATLLVEGRITRVERRKVYVTAALYDPAKGGRDDDSAVHAVGEGIVVLNKGILVVEPIE